MKPFLSSKRKLMELLVLAGLNIGLYFVWEDITVLLLFSLGFVWNWAASQPVDYINSNKRYRFSLMKMVYNLESLFMKPFRKLPAAFSIIPKILPAGIFWGLVIHAAESDVPWWPTFIGSLVFEITQLDSVFIKADVPPELPP